MFEVELLEFKEEDLTDEEDRGSSGEYGHGGRAMPSPTKALSWRVRLTIWDSPSGSAVQGLGGFGQVHTFL